MAEILDSGMRREFETGAVRDMAEGKGRCDLMPLDVVAQIMNDSIITEIESYRQTGSLVCLYNALRYFIAKRYESMADAMLELSVHFEEGAKKYGEYNWQKGLPPSSFIDSGVRHYFKWLRGDEDERHDRAFMWNIVCLIWTDKNEPGVTHSLDEVKAEIFAGGND
jgi:hypothetical protein